MAEAFGPNGRNAVSCAKPIDIAFIFRDEKEIFSPDRSRRSLLVSSMIHRCRALHAVLPVLQETARPLPGTA